VPRHVLERRLGSTLESAAVEELVEQALTEVLEKNGIRPAAQVKLDELEVTPEKAIRLRISVEVVPEFELKPYTGLKLTQHKPQGFETEFEKRLQELRLKCATFKPVSRPAQEHDFLVVDYGVTAAGALVDNPRTNVMIELGDPMNFPEVNQALLGAQPGNEISVAVTFPANHPDPGRAGKTQTYRFLVKDVKERILPEVNEEFAQDLGLESLDALRKEINEEILADRARLIEEDLKNQVFDQLTEQYRFEPPDSWVKFHLDRLRRQVPLPEDAAVTSRLQAIAVKWARFDCLVTRIAAQENITVTAEEVKAHIQKLAAALQKDPAELAGLGDSPTFRNELLREKVLAFILERAEISTQAANPSLEIASK